MSGTAGTPRTAAALSPHALSSHALPRRAWPRSLRAGRHGPVRAMLAAGPLLLGLALSGCAQQATASPPIEVSTAYVNIPTAAGSTEAYLAIRNRGPADRLTSARTSVGGVVTFRSPASHPGGVVRTVPDIDVPARGLLRLNPDGYHLLIIKPGKMVPGTEFTITLTFARAGPVPVTATVTDPENGGNSYLGD